MRHLKDFDKQYGDKVINFLEEIYPKLKKTLK